MKLRTTSLLQRIGLSFKFYGIRGSILKLCWQIGDRLFDIKYGVNTCTFAQLNQLTIDSDNRIRGSLYQPTRVMPLRKMFDAIKPMITSDSVFVDLGCGKGRVLLVASEFGFREVRGIEFAKELCEIANDNCTFYKEKTRVKTEFRIVESDVADYAIDPDENIFFMYNPFDDKILTKVLHNIATSLLIHPRKILIIYLNPIGRHVVESSTRFLRFREMDYWGHHFIVYSAQE